MIFWMERQRSICSCCLWVCVCVCVWFGCNVLRIVMWTKWIKLITCFQNISSYLATNFVTFVVEFKQTHRCIRCSCINVKHTNRMILGSKNKQTNKKSTSLSLLFFSFYVRWSLYFKKRFKKTSKAPCYRGMAWHGIVLKYNIVFWCESNAVIENSKLWEMFWENGQPHRKKFDLNCRTIARKITHTHKHIGQTHGVWVRLYNDCFCHKVKRCDKWLSFKCVPLFLLLFCCFFF